MDIKIDQVEGIILSTVIAKYNPLYSERVAKVIFLLNTY